MPWCGLPSLEVPEIVFNLLACLFLLILGYLVDLVLPWRPELDDGTENEVD